MAFLVNIFWTHSQQRLRAGWRIFLAQALWLTLMFLASLPLLALLLVSLALDSGGPPLNDVLEMPAFFYSNAFVGLVATVPAVWLAGRFLDRRKFNSFGLRLSKDWWLDLLFGLLLGAVLMAMLFLAQYLLGWIEIRGTFYAESGGFLLHSFLLLLVFLAVGFYEELLSRGYHTRNLAEGFNHSQRRPRLSIWLAFLLSSGAFGVMHAMNPNASPMSTFNIAIAGAFLGLGYIFTGELAIPIGVHITWNFFQGVVFGFPVSGMLVSARVFDLIQQGPAAWTGANFGPEAGYLGLITMLVGSLATLVYLRLRYGRLRIHLDLAAYQPRKPRAAEMKAEVNNEIQGVLE